MRTYQEFVLQEDFAEYQKRADTHMAAASEIASRPNKTLDDLALMNHHKAMHHINKMFIAHTPEGEVDKVKVDRHMMDYKEALMMRDAILKKIREGDPSRPNPRWAATDEEYRAASAYAKKMAAENKRRR